MAWRLKGSDMIYIYISIGAQEYELPVGLGFRTSGFMRAAQGLRLVLKA